MRWDDIYDKSHKISKQIIYEDNYQGSDTNTNICKDIAKDIQSEKHSTSHFNAEKAYRKFIKLKQKRIALRFMAVACSIIIIFGIIFIKQNKHHQNVHKIIPGSHKATLTLANGISIELKNSRKELCEKNGTSIIIDSTRIVYSHNNKSDKENVIFNTLDIPRGGEFFVELEDGTKVWLNAETKLKFPTNFTGNERIVYLDGEAYFSVTKSTKPFMVITDMGIITAYGTEFNVKQYYSDKAISTTLLSGSIGYKKDNDEFMLSPGYKLTYSSLDKSPTIRKAKIKNEIAWKSKQFCFDAQSLEDIMKILARWYDVDIIFKSDNIKNILFSGVINKQDDIQTFIRIFEAGADIKIDIHNRCLIISNK